MIKKIDVLASDHVKHMQSTLNICLYFPSENKYTKHLFHAKNSAIHLNIYVLNKKYTAIVLLVY